MKPFPLLTKAMAVLALALGLLRTSGQDGVPASLRAFTYQGSLADGDAPAGGPHDFEFRLYDAEAGSFARPMTWHAVGGPVTIGR